MISGWLVFVKWFSALIHNIIELSPKVQTMFLTLIQLSFFRQGFYCLNEIIRLLDNLKHRSGIGITNCICVNFNKEK